MNLLDQIRQSQSQMTIGAKEVKNRSRSAFARWECEASIVTSEFVKSLQSWILYVKFPQNSIQAEEE